MKLKKLLFLCVLGLFGAQSPLISSESRYSQALEKIVGRVRNIKTPDLSQLPHAAEKVTKVGGAVLIGTAAIAVVAVMGYLGYKGISSTYNWLYKPASLTAQQIKDTKRIAFLRSLKPIYNTWIQEQAAKHDGTDKHIIVVFNNITGKMRIFNEATYMPYFQSAQHTVYDPELLNPQCTSMFRQILPFITSQEKYEEFIGNVFMAYILQYEILPSLFPRYNFINIEEPAFGYIAQLIEDFAVCDSGSSQLPLLGNIHPDVVDITIARQIDNPTHRTVARNAASALGTILTPGARAPRAPIIKYRQLYIELEKYCRNHITETTIASYFNIKPISNINILANTALHSMYSILGWNI